MKKCKCKLGSKLAKLLLKVIGVFLIANIALFVVFFFDLDGKLLFHVVEPFLKKHYDNMERKDTTLHDYDTEKFGKYDYE